MNIEHTGSAIIQLKYLISNDEMITPTLPNVSAMMCRNTPCKILFSWPPCEWPWPPPWECPWLWEWPCEPSSPWECPWWPPPWLKAKIPIKLTMKPRTETKNRRSCFTSGGSANRWKSVRDHVEGDASHSQFTISINKNERQTLFIRRRGLWSSQITERLLVLQLGTSGFI